MNAENEYMRLQILRQLGGDYKMQRNENGFVSYEHIFEPLPMSEAAALGETPSPSVEPKVEDYKAAYEKLNTAVTSVRDSYKTIAEDTGKQTYDFVFQKTGDKSMAETLSASVKDHLERNKTITDLFIPQTAEDVAFMAGAGPAGKVLKSSPAKKVGAAALEAVKNMNSEAK